jgi:hypothetical protein
MPKNLSPEQACTLIMAFADFVYEEMTEESDSETTFFKEKKRKYLVSMFLTFLEERYPELYGHVVEQTKELR